MKLAGNSGIKVLFVLPRMVSGGVERVTLSLAREFREDGIDCSLALRKAHGELLDEAQSLMPVHELAAGGMQQFIPALTRLLRDLQPSHVITAFNDISLLTLIALKQAKSSARLVHGIHNTHAIIAARPNFTGKARHYVENRMAAFVYARADALVAVSEGIRQEAIHDFGVASARVSTIYNPVVSAADIRTGRHDDKAESRTVKLVSIGRLTHQKGYDVLIQAMAFVATDRPWQLEIYGNGEDQEALAGLIKQQGLQERIRLCGYTADPFSSMAAADIFVFPSRYEGLGIVLVEAMACGLQIVASDCPHGPAEILKDGQLGLLVPPENPRALAEALVSAIERRHYIAPALLQARAMDFTLTTAARQWEQLLQSLADQPRTTPGL